MAVKTTLELASYPDAALRRAVFAIRMAGYNQEDPSNLLRLAMAIEAIAEARRLAHVGPLPSTPRKAY